MRYIGSKTSTLPWLTAFVAKRAPHARSLCDPFAGTCTVARAFKRAGFRVVTGDVLDLSHVLQMTVYVSNADFWGRVNAVYAKVMGDASPARAIVPVNAFRGGWQVEIQAIAAVPQAG